MLSQPIGINPQTGQQWSTTHQPTGCLRANVWNVDSINPSQITFITQPNVSYDILSVGTNSTNMSHGTISPEYSLVDISGAPNYPTFNNNNNYVADNANKYPIYNFRLHNVSDSLSSSLQITRIQRK